MSCGGLKRKMNYLVLSLFGEISHVQCIPRYIYMVHTFDFHRSCPIQCVITLNLEQILTVFVCCIDTDSKPIIGDNIVWSSTQGACYSVLGKMQVFHNFEFNAENILPNSFFLFDNDHLNPKVLSVSQRDFWGKFFTFCIKYHFDRHLHFLYHTDNYLRVMPKNMRTVNICNNFWIKSFQNVHLW